MGWRKTLIIFVIGCFILIALVNPHFTEKMTELIRNRSRTIDGPPEVDFGEIKKTYEEGYIPQYLWNNYGNQKIKISDVGRLSSLRSSGNIISPFVSTAPKSKNFDYYFKSTMPDTHPGEPVYLIDNKNVISKAEEKYNSPIFTVIGIVKKKKIDVAWGDYQTNYENLVVIQATEIKVHPR